LYMLELNQRSDALHQRDLEIQRLQEQLRLVESAVEDGAAQLANLRRERDVYELQVRELESQRPRTRPADIAPALEPDTVPGPEAADDLLAPLSLAGDPPPPTMRLVEEKAAAPPPRPVRRIAVSNETRVGIHVEDHAALRHA